MHDITRFTLADMTTCGAQLREMCAEPRSMEAAAWAMVRYQYENPRSPKGRACVMARLYKTIAYGELPAELRDVVHHLAPAQSLSPNTKCWTLLGTAGDQREWNNRRASRRHQSIPLPDERAIERMPMIAQMMRQFGFEPSALLATAPEVIDDLDRKNCNVFFVPDAQISPFMTEQAEFVIPYVVKSALGCGGLLPSGDLFAVIMFTRVPIPLETAQMFRTIALNVKLNLLRFVGGRVFADALAAAQNGINADA
jgi:hypothetical protein